MTRRYIALLRAVNVGGRVVRMDALRRYFGTAGFACVETVIQTGNVVFECAEKDSAALESRIEGLLADELGYRVATFLRTAPELAAASHLRPFADEARVKEDSLYVAFVRSQLRAADRTRIEGLSNAVDDLRVGRREIYWLRRSSVGESTVSGAVIERALGAEATVRNITTVERIVVKYCMPIARTSRPRGER